MALSHRALLMSYISGVTLVSTTLGGFVACGAQKYRVPIHGIEAENESNPSSGNVDKIASNLEGVHSSSGWAKRLPIRFKTSVDVSEPVVKELREAMTVWEKAVGMQLFTYDGVENVKGDSFKELYDPLKDSVNGHYFDFNWSKNTGKSYTVLATTIWENEARDVSAIAKADIRYNNEYYKFGDSLSEFSDAKRIIVDMQSLALHELGHLLGLKHVDVSVDRYSVMNPSLFIGEGLITRNLSHGDIQRIRQVYKGGDESIADALTKADDMESASSQ